jgi:transketolase
MATSQATELKLKELKADFPHWEKTKDLVDQLIDIILNYRQSGHPGGSRSKVHALLSTMLSGVMRWDIRHPEKRFADRFVLVGGHAVPLVYCTLAVLNEALRIKHQQTGETRYANPNPLEQILYWEDLINFREHGGLSGHAEMEGKTLFLKFNTGPSGHGAPAAAGEALALKRAGAGEVKVFAFDGEGGFTSGGVQETLNSAYGLELDNLYYILDWNDFGIDGHPVSSAVYGTPKIWFESHGWQVHGTEEGSQWESVTATFLETIHAPNPSHSPKGIWLKTRKGRGYLKYDYASHGAPHAINSALFWQIKQEFAEKYNARFVNFGGAAPENPTALKEEFFANLNAVIDVLRQDQVLVDYLADTLVNLGESVPGEISSFELGKKGNPYKDPRLFDFKNYPADLFAKPGDKAPNRAALSKWGAWVNAFGASEYGRPLFLVASADLTESTNLSGFGAGYADFEGYGWYRRFGKAEGVILPQEITEFANSGIMCGLATVNFSEHPEKEFDGFWGACSTYGSFSYLKYGMFRLFSQLSQDCQLKVGKIIWIAGHSGPETADDSRTHFGIFSPGVTQLFPKGKIINLYPWEHNEVPVLLGAALNTDVPIIALHLTRPSMSIPDREKLGIPSYFEAAKGAYIVRDYKPGIQHGGTVIVQGTSAMASILKILPQLDQHDVNVKIICATSPELFAMQSDDYQSKVITKADQMDSTVITTQARWLMHDWLYNKIGEKYALSSDWDDRWRTGGRLNDVIEEAHLSPEWIFDGIKRFAADREQRLENFRTALAACRRDREEQMIGTLEQGREN